MKLKFSFFLAFFAFCTFISCSNSPDDAGDSSSSGVSPSSSGNKLGSSSSGNNPSSSGNKLGSSSSGNSPSSSSYINLDVTIEYKNGGTPNINNLHEDEVSVDLTGEHIVVSIDTTTDKEYNLVVSGTTTGGSLKIYGNYKIRLHLNGVNITNPNGPAINVQNGKKISVYLEGNNYLTDGVNYNEPVEEEQAKGTFFSEGQLVFSGEGYLEVRGKGGHAIVTDDYFKIESGTIKIPEAAKDGIHSNDTLFIEGGNLDITSIGDGLQSERDAVAISGGTVKMKVSGDGSKGIKANKSVIIRQGTIDITTSGAKSVSAEDTSSVAGIKAKNNIEMYGGDLKVVSSGKGGKGISADEDIYINNGKVDITADNDAIKTNRDLTINGGNITLRSITKKKDNVIDCDGTEYIRVSITTIGKP